jgi:hypothetical protein
MFHSPFKCAQPFLSELESSDSVNKSGRREIFRQGKVQKHRKALCLSSFQTAALAEKIHLSAAVDRFGDSLLLFSQKWPKTAMNRSAFLLQNTMLFFVPLFGAIPILRSAFQILLFARALLRYSCGEMPRSLRNITLK